MITFITVYYYNCSIFLLVSVTFLLYPTWQLDFSIGISVEAKTWYIYYLVSFEVLGSTGGLQCVPLR